MHEKEEIDESHSAGTDGASVARRADRVQIWFCQ